MGNLFRSLGDRNANTVFFNRGNPFAVSEISVNADQAGVFLQLHQNDIGPDIAEVVEGRSGHELQVHKRHEQGCPEHTESEDDG